MGKSIDQIMNREEYEQKVKKHIDAIRRLMKRFNPEANHCSMAIVDEGEWAITYIPDIGKGKARKISDWYCKHTDDGTEIAPYFESRKIPDEQ